MILKGVFDMKLLSLAIVAAVMTVLLTQSALGQKASAVQVVALQVKELNKMDLVGGPLMLQISGVSDISNEPNPAADVSTKLVWTSNGERRKIAVGSNIASPRFVLKIEAEKSGAGGGVAQPEVTLSDNSPHDLIVGVGRSAGSCILKFTAMADVEQGAETETRLITYTITGS